MGRKEPEGDIHREREGRMRRRHTDRGGEEWE